MQKGNHCQNQFQGGSKYLSSRQGKTGKRSIAATLRLFSLNPIPRT